MDIFSLPRLGVAVPPENPTAEPELNRLLCKGMNVYAARFPVTPGMGLRAMLETYNRVLPDILAAFGSMSLDAAVVACSASHYLLGPHGDRALCDELSARAGFPVQSSPQAILATCEWLDVTRLTLVSPYQPWLTDISKGFWEQAGLTVEGVVRVPAANPQGKHDHYDPYQVTTGEIVKHVRQHQIPEGSALLFTGTGMSTLAYFTEFAREYSDRPVLSSNLASAWWAKRAVGSAEDWHPLLRGLESRMVPSR